MNPFKLYLQITILFFLVVGIFKTIDQFKLEDSSSAKIAGEFNANNSAAAIDSITSETLRELKESDIKIDSTTLSAISAGVAKVSQKIDSSKSKSSRKDENKQLVAVFIDSIVSAPGSLETFKLDSTYQNVKDSLVLDYLKSLDTMLDTLLLDQKDINVETFDDGWYEISKKGTLKKQAIKQMDSIFKANEINYKISKSLVRNSEADWLKSNFEKVKSFMEYQKENTDASTSEALESLEYEKNYWNVFLYSKSGDWNEAVEDPENYGTEFIDRILSRVSVALFFLLPLFTLIVSLLYIRRKFNYTENLVFVFHVQTVFFLLLLLFIIIGRILHSDGIVWIFLIIFMIHLYMSMRQFYQQGWFKTLIKYILLNTAFMFLAAIGGIIISFIAFML